MLCYVASMCAMSDCNYPTHQQTRDKIACTLQKSTRALEKRKAKADREAALQARQDIRDKIKQCKAKLSKHPPKSKGQTVNQLKHQINVLTVCHYNADTLALPCDTNVCSSSNSCMILTQSTNTADSRTHAAGIECRRSWQRFKTPY